MKKNILILSLILAGAVGFILVLVGQSDPETPLIDRPRQYHGIEAIAEDSFPMPGRLIMMEVAGPSIYGYLAKQKMLIRYDMISRQVDTLLHSPDLFSGQLRSIAMDPDSAIFYFLGARTNNIYCFHAQGGRKDSLSGGNILMAGAEKCVTGPAFFIRSLDKATSLTALKKEDCLRHTDSTLYTFTQFPDSGISEDGFFCKDSASQKQFYIPFYNSEIIQYDERSNKVSKIITLDKTRPFNCAIPVPGGYSISSKSRMLNLAAAADSAHLFVLSYTTSPGQKELPGTVVDIYSTSTGNYESSIRFPYYKGSPVTLLKRSGDRLYVTFSDYVLSYKIQQHPS